MHGNLLDPTDSDNILTKIKQWLYCTGLNLCCIHLFGHRGDVCRCECAEDKGKQQVPTHKGEGDAEQSKATVAVTCTCF